MPHPSPSAVPVDFVIFGGTGDLALRKLLPALFRCFLAGQFAAPIRVLAAAPEPLTNAEYRQRVRLSLDCVGCLPRQTDAFVALLEYFILDGCSEQGWGHFATAVLQAGTRLRVFYLATSSSLYTPICRRLAANGLVDGAVRMVLEKPLGHDCVSAAAINFEVSRVFREQDIFRIDHYLGKEAVQNLTALRFGNALFEPMWNSMRVDHVQITVAETVGADARAAYYGQTGALRDMVQNHLLQLLCLVAMEPPASLHADAVRDEKVKVLRAIEPIEGIEVGRRVVRGRYQCQKAAPAGVALRREVETFVALKLSISNWRWAGVPFYLRTGKCLCERTSEIVVSFRPAPHAIFSDASGDRSSNRLVIRLQPDEGVKLWMVLKEPGLDGRRLRRVPLNMSFVECFGIAPPDAYDRLLMDVMHGRQMLFMRRDEVEAAWSWIDPIVDEWSRTGGLPEPYAAGSWGPAGAASLMARDQRLWQEEWRRTIIECGEAAEPA